MCFQQDDRQAEVGGPFRGDIGIVTGEIRQIEPLGVRIRDTRLDLGFPEHEAVGFRNPPEGLSEVCDYELQRACPKQPRNIARREVPALLSHQRPLAGPKLLERKPYDDSFVWVHAGLPVLAERRPAPDTLYSEIGQSTLLTFGEPYRAEAFIERLEDESPGLTLDWFRRGTGEFEVVMTYANREAFDQSARLLERAGFRVD